MKLAISNIAWNDEYSHYYKLMQQHGFNGLEIAPIKFSATPYANLGTAKQVCDELLSQYQLPIVSMQALLYGANDLAHMAMFTTVAARELLKDYLQQAIIYAQTVHCPVLVFGNPKQRIMRQPESDYQLGVTFFRELGQFAKEHDTCLCIEPNPKEYGTNFINTLAAAKQLVDDVDNAGFAMIIDTSTMLLNHDSPQLALPVLDSAKHIHISMPFLAPLCSEYNKYASWLDEFLSLLKAHNYKYYLSIEMANAKASDIVQSMKILQELVYHS